MPKTGLLFIVIATLLGAIGTATILSADSHQGEATVKAHLTLYVGGELLRNGGTVIVSSIPIPVDELRAMTGPNPAAKDANNAKREYLDQDDILLGAYVTGRANFVEMYYPEGGTFGFNLVADPREATITELITERLLVGASRWPDPKNPGVWIEADTSTIFVDGPKSSKNESRLVRVIESRVNQLEPAIVRYNGVRVKIPTSSQLNSASSGEIE
ncbi:hypothetical protein H4P12_13770 [Paracoccus sp. 11-3]|uniref:Uncharacterized protein n=1 Tax=Paracoccus amoyensis TaxID=2760093 RepID=A0A926GPS7_9RHOB|nr:hypothetical protein [Paracoccus amoyensis]MBC9247745.1 hypothetical protein [Paracoccus amoyensis]